MKGKSRRLLLGSLVLVALALAAIGAIAVQPASIVTLERWASQRPKTLPSRVAEKLVEGMGRFAPSLFRLPPPPPMAIGMNAPGFQWYEHVAPFANLMIGSTWLDPHWSALDQRFQDRDGNLLATPGTLAYRFVNVPPTGAAGIEVACSWRGSGELSVWGGGTRLSSAPHRISFRVVNRHGADGPPPWLRVEKVDPAQPLRDLDCRESTVPPATLFRRTFVDTLRGYPVIRFMDWQNANANAPVTWATRHRPGGNRLIEADGVPVEDMMALVRELDADPWFVMPWNADDTYLTGFATMVAKLLPAQRHVYIETANEVWNKDFPVAQQAIREGLARGLGPQETTAQMRRYAQRTVEVMRIWERAFGGRAGLVRVLSAEHAWPDPARMALSFGDTSDHIDALATAPYFGALLGGYDNRRDAILRRLSAELDTTLAQTAANRRVAAAFGKRYIGYEGGEGLALPAQKDLTQQMQYDPAQLALYRRFLAGWRREAGDVLCIYTNVMLPAGNGAWGLAAWEDETPAQAPKLRAVREAAAQR